MLLRLTVLRWVLTVRCLLLTVLLIVLGWLLTVLRRWTRAQWTRTVPRLTALHLILLRLLRVAVPEDLILRNGFILGYGFAVEGAMDLGFEVWGSGC